MTPFTEELRTKLLSFVRDSSDDEFYQALLDADYEYFSKAVPEEARKAIDDNFWQLVC